MPNSAKNLTNLVFEDIKNKILKGEYPPDHQLVNRTIAKQLEVSTIPVREAIQKLVSACLVEHRHGDGFFVRKVGRTDLIEIYDVRAVLEPLAASYLARGSTPELVKQFTDILTEWELIANELVRDMWATISDDQMVRWVKIDERFHNHVADSCGNRWIANLMSCTRLIVYAFYFHKVHPEQINATLAMETLKSHRQFVELIAAKNVDGAAEWSRQRVQMLREYMLKFATD